MATVIDTIRTTYIKLFSVDLLHEAYQTSYMLPNPDHPDVLTPVVVSGIFQALDVLPDEATKRIFASHQMGLQCSNNLVSCFVRVQDQRPFVAIPADSVIRLLLRYKSDFLNRTQAVATGSREVYFFSNSNHTMENGIKYISKNAAGVSDADKKDISAITRLQENCWGLIDIMIGETDDNYRVLNNGTVAGPAFTIKFIKK